MNLVNELQISAEQDDVLTVLRKTKRLASKLNRDDITAWLECEQQGYSAKQDVPHYRNVMSTVAFDTNGYIPAGFGRLMRGISDMPSAGVSLPMPVQEPISTILSWVANETPNTKLCMPIPEGRLTDSLRSQFDPMFADQITFLFRLNIAQVRAIPDQIKDRVLDWACALERAGVKGEGMSFDDKEKEIGHTVTFNINNSTVGQLTNSGSNHTTGA